MDEIVRYYEAFDEWSRLGTPAGRLEFARALEILDRELAPGSRVLDLGGGPGRYAIALGERRHRVTLVDLSPRQVEVARGKLAEAGLPADAHVGDARDLARFADDSFDAVLAFGPFYHLVDPDDRAHAAREAHRVLRPGGALFLLYLPRLSGLRGLVERGAAAPEQVRAETLRRCADDGVFRNASPSGFQAGWYPTTTEIRGLVEAAGFRVERIESLKGILAGREVLLDRLAPDLHDEVLRVVRETAEACVELGDQAIAVAKRR